MTRLRKGWLIGGALALALSGAFVGGPRVDLTFHPQAVELPQDLERYLRESEAKVPNLRPATDKKIVWARPAAKTQTPIALVYLHGFSATRQEIAPVCDRLAAQLGANLFYTRLTGHGRDGSAMAEATVTSWLQDGIEALQIGRRLGHKVVVVATSTGATLATWLVANGHARDVAAAVLISPNFGPRDSRSEMLLWPWGEQIARRVVGPEFRWQPVNALHGRYWTNEFPVEALLPMMGLVELGRRSDLEAVRTPVLVFYSTDDQIVDSSAIEAQFTRFGSMRKQLTLIEHSDDPRHHVIAGEILSPSTTDEIVRRAHEFLAPLHSR